MAATFQPNARSADSRRAFTLIEVLISAALMSLILVAAYSCLHGALASQKMIEPRATVFQNARVAMALMSADLRCACPLSKDSDFLGMHRMMGSMPADNLDFATHNYTPQHDGEGDYCQVSLYLDKDPQSGLYTLYRRRNPAIALDPLSGGSREEIATGLLGMQFDYYDGYEWYDTWGEVDRRSQSRTSRKEQYNLSGMPEAVRITLWFESNPQAKPAKSGDAPEGQSGNDKAAAVPLVFQTIARLNLTKAAQDAATATPDASGGNANPTPTAPGGSP
jgi:prepilin-type N-terminal cleavage/methylation domain-containing protein